MPKSQLPGRAVQSNMAYQLREVFMVFSSISAQGIPASR
jgi:hypothetical protein